MEQKNNTDAASDDSAQEASSPSGQDLPLSFKLNPQRKPFFLIAMGLIAATLVFSWYSVYVDQLIAHAPLTSLCNQTTSNELRNSIIAFDYGFLPSHWNNLSNYMNVTCINFQNNAILEQNPGEQGILNIASQNVVNTSK